MRGDTVGAVPAAGSGAVLSGGGEGARHETLAAIEAIEAVVTRSDATTVAPAEIIAEMTRRGTRYPDSTIRTMIGSHPCRNAASASGALAASSAKPSR